MLSASVDRRGETISIYSYMHGPLAVAKFSYFRSRSGRFLRMVAAAVTYAYLSVRIHPHPDRETTIQSPIIYTALYTLKTKRHASRQAYIGMYSWLAAWLAVRNGLGTRGVGVHALHTCTREQIHLASLYDLDRVFAMDRIGWTYNLLGSARIGTSARRP
jgi:hypothetical protein